MPVRVPVFVKKPAAPVLALWLGAGALLGPGAARAERWLYGGEVRVSSQYTAGREGQFGEPDGSGPCGPEPQNDGAVLVDATGVLMAKTPRYTYRLGLAAAYRGYFCTSALRQPLFGLDFRADHRLSERAYISGTLRATLDAFDRNVDIRTASAEADAAQGPGETTRGTAGTRFLILGGGLEGERRFAGRSGLRLGAAGQALVIFAEPGLFSQYTTLGPMEAGEAFVAPFYDNTRHRVEVPLRYRVSHYYPATLQPASKERGGPEWSFTEVPVAHDGSLRGAYEHRPSPLSSVRVEAGLAYAHMGNLCLPRDPLLIEAGSCSIDRAASGVRGAEGAPPLEVGIGQRGVGTLVGAVSYTYQGRRLGYEVTLSRDYEPNAYAGALDLVDRLRGDLLWRPRRDLTLVASAQAGHMAHTSLGRVNVETGALGMQTVSPQNRTLYMMQGAVGMDYKAAGPLAFYVRADAQVFGIKGERVVGRTPGGVIESPVRYVSPFPQEAAADPMNPPVPPLPAESYQSVWRVGLTVGVRLFALPSSRDEAALLEARALP